MICAATLLFGSVERQVGVFHQRVAILAVNRGDRDADAHPVMMLNVKRLSHDLDDSAGEQSGLFRFLQPARKDLTRSTPPASRTSAFLSLRPALRSLANPIV